MIASDRACHYNAERSISFKSERYLGVNKDAVRANRLIDVLPVEPLAIRPTDWNTALRRKYKHLVSWVKCYVYTWLGIWR